ncbi:MAG: hypothetical protein ACI9CF_001063 [Candidatus Omnitrophota bacterium]
MLFKLRITIIEPARIEEIMTDWKGILSVANNVANLKDIAELQDLAIDLRGIVLSLQEDKNIYLEKNMNLLEEISNLRKEVQVLNDNLVGKDDFPDDVKFVPNLGFWSSEETGLTYCTSCKQNGMMSPLSVSSSGWHCEVKSCDKYYSNPNWEPPRQAVPYSDF